MSIAEVGTMTSGFEMSRGGGQARGIWAGYTPGGVATVNTNVHGDVVVDSGAIINAASGVGIGLYNWSVGNISAILEASSSITAVSNGVDVFAQGGGNVTIVNSGTVTTSSGIGIFAGTRTGLATTANGIISINNSGAITSLGSTNNPVIQINNDSSQGATFTNSGTVPANLFSAG